MSLWISYSLCAVACLLAGNLQGLTSDQRQEEKIQEGKRLDQELENKRLEDQRIEQQQIDKDLENKRLEDERIQRKLDDERWRRRQEDR
jgi:formate hydrogenlyase subunit 6/NADH:ubiquinone oxidoreductase subunit I